MTAVEVIFARSTSGRTAAQEQPRPSIEPILREMFRTPDVCPRQANTPSAHIFRAFRSLDFYKIQVP